MKDRKNIDRYYWNKRKKNEVKSKKSNLSNLTYRVIGDSIHLSVPVSNKLFAEMDHDLFIQFLISINQAASKKNSLVVNFNNCREIQAPCLLVLYATLEDCLARNESLQIIIKDMGAPKRLKRLIMQCGLKTIMSEKIEKIDFKNVVSLPIQTNETADSDNITDYVQYSVFNGKITPEQEYILGRAVEETMLNVKYHAYMDDEEKKYWVITDVVGSNQLYLAIYDIGIGIPKSAPKTKWIKELATQHSFLRSILLQNKDEELIDISMELSKSSSGLTERGLGSRSIRELVDTNPEGELFVFSGKGGYAIEKSGAKRLTSYKSSLAGTLVQWNIEI